MKRSAMFKVTPEFLIQYVLTQTDFVDRYPGADHTAIHYDFDTNCFWFKFRHHSLEEVADGERIPFIEPPRVRGMPARLDLQR